MVPILYDKYIRIYYVAIIVWHAVGLKIGRIVGPIVEHRVYHTLVLIIWTTVGPEVCPTVNPTIYLTLSLEEYSCIQFQWQVYFECVLQSI